MVTEKYDRELEKIDEKVKHLNALKKDVQLKRESAVKAHVFGDFEKKKIPIDRFLYLSELSKSELESILNAAENLSKKNRDKSGRADENRKDDDEKDGKDHEEKSNTNGYGTGTTFGGALS